MTRPRLKFLLLFLWSFLFVKTVKAATMAEFVGGYDSQLLQWAAATALLGGVVRTILSLESDKRIIKDIAHEAMWDMGKALVAGLAAFLLIQALRSAGWAIPSEVRFTAVLAAGWHRIAALNWIFGAVKDWLDSRKQVAINSPSAVETLPKETP